MITTKLKIFILITIIQYSLPERRINFPNSIKTPKRYVVYFVKAPNSPKTYDYWLCGGALVNTQMIVTSAACIMDVQHMYAIAGYQYSVTTGELDKDPCTKAMKKKVTQTCVPIAYNFSYAKEQWSRIDIAVAMVESPFDFDSELWLSNKCSYKPQSIRVNYHEKYQKPNVTAIVIGWGFNKTYRKPGDTKNYNLKTISYAPVLLANNTECRNEFRHDGALFDYIGKYVICSWQKGDLDSEGLPYIKPKGSDKLTGPGGCLLDEKALRQGKEVCSEEEAVPSEHKQPFLSLRKQSSNFGTTGFCQNDHGDPLVTWIGSHEVLIGVASIYRQYHNNDNCGAPYLYSSTHYNANFLECIINPPTRRRAICNKSPGEKGFDVLETTISWNNHPDGAADNEMFRQRPQNKPSISLSDLYFSDYYFWK